MLPIGVTVSIIVLFLVFGIYLPKKFKQIDMEETSAKIAENKRKVAQAGEIEQFEENNPNYKLKINKVKQFK